MRKQSKIDTIIEELSHMLESTDNIPDIGYLKKCITNKNNCVIAKAAECIAKFRLSECQDTLITTYDRLLNSGHKTDRACIGQKAIVKALDKLGCDDLDWFINAAECIQIEPVYGGTIDSGEKVRTQAIRSLIRFPWYSVAYPLTIRLGDPEPNVRIAVIETLLSFGGREAEIAIIAKAVSGDVSPEVMSCCFLSLLSLNPEIGIPLVAAFLQDKSESIRIEAALALGQSRDDRAYHYLYDGWEACSLFEMKKMYLTAISVLRTENAVDFLLDMLGNPHYKDSAYELLCNYPPEVIERANAFIQHGR